MARALLGLLVVAALGVTGFYTYNYMNNDGTCCHSEAAAVKRSCCTHDVPASAAKSCCSESGECTGECSKVAAEGESKCCEGKKEGSCCEGKEGGCCKEKKEDGKKE